MSFVRSFFINFIAAFLINRLAPDVEITFYDKVPNLGADLIFSIAVAFLNAIIFPALYILEINPTPLKMGILACLFSFGSYIAIAFLPFGIHVNSALGVIVAGTFVSAAGFITNYLEWRQDMPN